MVFFQLPERQKVKKEGEKLCVVKGATAAEERELVKIDLEPKAEMNKALNEILTMTKSTNMGTHIITSLMAQTCEQQIVKTDEAWCKTHLSTVMPNQSRVQPTPQAENKTFDFNQIVSPIVTSKHVIMPPVACM